MISKIFKIFFFYTLSSVFLINSAFSVNSEDLPNWDLRDLQKNINNHGFKIVSTTIANNGVTPIEIITLEKRGFILKCSVRYTPEQFFTYCNYP